MKKYLAEGIGTMFLVLLACGSAVLAGPKIGVLGIGLCFGLVLLCLVYCIGNISGCHVNPAVSIAMWLDGRMSFPNLSAPQSARDFSIGSSTFLRDLNSEGPRAPHLSPQMSSSPAPMPAWRS